MFSNILLTLNRILGFTGRYRLSAGQTATGTVFAVKAYGGNFIYNSGCVASQGQAPLENETLVAGEVDLWPADVVRAKTGTAYVYGRGIVIS
jgi:hypothetical protein